MLFCANIKDIPHCQAWSVKRTVRAEREGGKNQGYQPDPGSAAGGSGVQAFVLVLTLACALSTVLLPITEARAAGETTISPSPPEGLSLVSGFSAGTVAAGTPAGSGAPCLGLGAGETSLTRCLSRGGGLDQAPAAVTLGVRYGFDGWLNVGVGVGVEPGLRDAGAGLGVSSADAPTWNGTSPGTERMIGSLSAFVDVSAATGLHLGGMRPYLGANFAVGRASTPGGMTRDGAGGAVAVSPMSATGITWGATAGSNVPLGRGLSLDFAYRYIGQEADGPLDHGAAFGLGASLGATRSSAGQDGNHGMSIGLRLRF